MYLNHLVCLTYLGFPDAIAEAKKYSFFTAIAADRNIDRDTVFTTYIYDRDIVTTAKYIG